MVYRPFLGKALHLAKVTGATLVIAKFDRLSRNAAFLLTLHDSGVRFSAVDLPEANDLAGGIMARPSPTMPTDTPMTSHRWSMTSLPAALRASERW